MYFVHKNQSWCRNSLIQVIELDQVVQQSVQYSLIWDDPQTKSIDAFLADFGHRDCFSFDVREF